MLIDDTQPEETRVVIVDGNKVEDVEFESTAKKQIKGNIFNAKIVRIEPSLQAAFVDYGGNRHGFLAFGEIHPDYYNISDEVRAEVEAEVDEIIERKRNYQLERKAEQERRRLEREQKRAEYEAKKLAEEQTKEESSEETTTETAATVETDVVYEEIDNSDTTPQTADETETTSSDDCGCSPNCACRQADGQCHCKENGVCTCSEECHCQETTETELTKTTSSDDCGCSPNCACRQADGQCHCKENGVCTCSEECHCQETEETDFVEYSSETSEETSVANDEETTSSTEETDSEETSESDTKYRGRRRSARFLGGRRPNKKYKVSAEATGIAGETIAEELSDEDLAPTEIKEENFDDDERTCRDFDNDEDEADFEHYLEVQRKLIFARKLYYRSTIQDVLKEGQTLLIQIVKEERGNKGAACTTYLSLAGRYCVLMPNRIKSGGVSRKITSASDRKRLKEIMRELPLNDNMSLIIRTAGEDKQREDIVRDYNYLIRTWNHIRHSALSTPAPALIYEEGDLIKRALRDMYTKDISEVIIDGDTAYQTAKSFSKILSPNMGRKIKCRKPDEKPLFQQYQVEKELDKLHNPVVQLPSGGYLVINPTEALVSIDVNSGRATHEMDIEETALKTNLEAADEIAKQLRMRNLAGLVVVDFIDMDEAANNHAVEKRMKEAMKSDRARVQIAKMSIFGLLEISRQRMHSSFVESNYTTCPYCKGQSVIRTAESSATLVLRAIEEEGIKGVNNHLELRLPSDTAVYILNHKRRQLADLEEKYGLEIIISTDLSIKNINDYKLEKSKIAAKKPETVAAAAAYAAANDPEEIADDDNEESYDTEEMYAEEETSPKKNRNNRYDKRKGKNFNRRKMRYNNRNREENEANTSASYPESSNDEPNDSQPEKKRTWWKKLLGE